MKSCQRSAQVFTTKACLLLTVLALGLPAVLNGRELAPAWQKRFPEAAGLQNFPLPTGALGTGKEFSVRIYLRPGALNHPGRLFEIMDTTDRPVAELEVSDGGNSGRVVRFLVTTDFRSEPLSVGFPVKPLAADAPHEILLRDLGFRLDFFVDGVLTDQEWPIGSVGSKGTLEVQSTSAIQDAQIWPSALRDDAIEHQNGGQRAVALRDSKMLGPQSQPMQYFRPRGYNSSAGDAMPFFHDGVLHVFYLLDRRHHKSKWSLGAHQWAHVSSTDLVHWKTYPMALTIEYPWEASICTGSVFFHDNKYYAFYATRMQDRSEHLGMAISEDGVHFHKLLPSPFEGPKPPYRPGPNRDPFVFADEHGFHLLVTASLAASTPPNHAGALEQLTSPDLTTWKVQPSPFLVTGYADDPECSDLFFWHGWYYLLFSSRGQAHYRMSRSLSRPWIKPAVDTFDGIEARVMKTAAFTGDRRIGIAFVPDGDFGGNLLFREVLQSPDGTLRTTFLREMTPPGMPGANTSRIAAKHDVKQSSNGVALAVTPSAAVAIPISKYFILKATLTASSTTSRFGFSFADDAGTNVSGIEFDPADERIQWTGTPSPAGALPFLDHVQDVVRPLKIQLVVQGTIADLLVNGHHSLIHRLPAPVGKRMLVLCNSGYLTVTDLTVRSTRRVN